MAKSKQRIVTAVVIGLLAAIVLLATAFPAIKPAGSMPPTSVASLVFQMIRSPGPLAEQFQELNVGPAALHEPDLLLLLGVLSALIGLLTLNQITMLALIRSYPKMAHAIALASGLLLVLFTVTIRSFLGGHMILDLLILGSCLLFVALVVHTILTLAHKQNGVDVAKNVVDETQSKASGQVIGLTGMFQDAVFAVGPDQEIVFGRDVQRCQVLFDQTCPRISRRHCSVRYHKASGRYSVRDYSKYGTFTQDGRRLLPNSTVSFPRDTVIYLGSAENMFRLA